MHLVFIGDFFWAWLALWWLKPAFDRALLAVLAPAIFGEARPAREFLSSPSRAFRRTGLLAALTWRRFDLARSFHLPVLQLERMSRKPLRQRLRILDRDSHGAAMWLTFLLSNVEIILTIAISLAVALLLPVQTPIDTLLEVWGQRQFSSGEAAGLAGTIVGAIAVSLVEPLYVACGFMLYLQRRTHLEGWDIELRFRHLAARLAPAAAAFLLAIGLVGGIPSAEAASPGNKQNTPAASEIREVLRDPVFGHMEPVRRLRYIGPEWKSDDKPKEWEWSWLKELAAFLAGAVRVIAWSAAAVTVALLIYYIARYIRLHARAGGAGARPDFLFGLDVRPESLPDDVGTAAAALAREGSVRGALSLLYRASLVRFMDDGLEFLHGDTEGDCVRRVEAFAAPKRLAYFMRLVAAWQAHAYAHETTDRDMLLGLAREWGSHFGAPRAGSAPAAQPQAA